MASRGSRASPATPPSGPKTPGSWLRLRPSAALFLRFGGIDYDGDPAAGTRLDAYIRWVQGVLARYDGETLRFFLLRTHYRSPFNFSDAHLDDARQALRRLYARRRQQRNDRRGRIDSLAILLEL